MNLSSPAIKYALILLSLGVIIFVLAFWLLRVHSSCVEQEYKLINPELRCEPKYVVDKQPYIGLRHELQTYVEAQEANGSVNEVSIYFRDLDNGPTFGVNEYADFVPASLLKLPILITYLNYETEHPGLLSEQLLVPVIAEDLHQAYPSRANLQAGKSYSVAELLEAMIVHSDNTALYRLDNYLEVLSPDQDLALQTFTDLGIIDPKNIVDETLTVKTYASLFSQLYNSSYFGSRDQSEKVLTLLSRANFNNGLVAGVPEGTAVAHKFGERSDLEGDLKQLHDCGIIYYPDNAYLLCVMTRGQEFSGLETTIQEISAMVYEEFDSRKLE